MDSVYTRLGDRRVRVFSGPAITFPVDRATEKGGVAPRGLHVETRLDPARFLGFLLGATWTLLSRESPFGETASAHVSPGRVTIVRVAGVVTPSESNVKRI